MTTFQELWDSHDGLYSTKHHEYPELYDRYLGRFAGLYCTLIEFGILRGGSLQLWSKFLGSQARIIGVDCEPHDDWKKLNGNAETVVGFQQDPQVLAGLPDAHIIIDDAGHFAEDQIVTFNTLFPRLYNGGVYVIEDLMPRNVTLLSRVLSASYLNFPVHVHREIVFIEKINERMDKITTGHV